MKIVIAGAGRVGGTVAEALTNEGYDVTIIDKDSDLISHISNDVDAICIEGSATDVEVLKEAGAGSADMFLAITEADETNLVSAVLAKKMGANHIIARLRNTEYLGKEGYVKEALDISMLSNPELLCAKEIARKIQFGSASHTTTFTAGGIEILRYRVKSDDKICGTFLKDIKSTSDAEILVCYIINENGVFIPKADYVFCENDTLAITGDIHNLKKFYHNVVKDAIKTKSVMIYGGGRIAIFLAGILVNRGIEVTVIEESIKRCEKLCELASRTHIVRGDGTNRNVMLEEGLEDMDAYIALTDDDGNNIITSIYAKHTGVDIVLSKVEHVHFAEMMEASILDGIIAPKILAAQQIVGYVRAISNSIDQEIDSIYYIEDGKLDALEFKINKESVITGVKLKDLRFKEDVKIVAIIRKSKTIVPNGNSIIEIGDTVVVIANANQIKKIEEALA